MNLKQIFGIFSVTLLAIVTASGGGQTVLAARHRVAPLKDTSPSTLPNGAMSTYYSTSLTASGGTTPYTWAITACSGACNTGLGFNASGVLSGAPANAGTSTFTFTVTDAKGQAASASSTLTIAAASSTPPASTPLSITSSSLPSGTVSSSYNASLAATGGTTPYTWSIKGCSGVCDPHLSLSQAGVLSGTPTLSGASTYSVGVTDATGQTASASLSMTIAAAPVTPLSITSSTLPNGTVSTSYTATLTATSGTTPYTWSLKGCSGVCDPNLTLSQAGVFSGTPASSGTSTYSVGVTDATGQTAAASLSLTIAAAPSSGSTANYYVSPSGSNSNPCTQASPCATPDYAVNTKASPGDIVQVAAGTYDYGSSAANFTASGTAGNFITVTCVTRGACKIQSATTGNTTIMQIAGSYLTFDGFEVTNTNPPVFPNNIGIFVTGSFVNITRNKIHGLNIDCLDNGGGAIITGVGTNHDITADSNLIYDIGWPDGGSPKCPASTVQFDGIILETNGGNTVITNNVIYHVSGGWGLGLGPRSGNVAYTVSNNLIFSNSNGGMVLTGGSDFSTISNNTLLNNGVVAGQCGINTQFATSDNNILEANNDMFNNAGGDICPIGTPIQSGNIHIDPTLGTTFVNWKADGSGDYHQKAGSPTINNGTSSTGAPKVDFDGNPRPQGAAYDIGTYESPN